MAENLEDVEAPSYLEDYMIIQDILSSLDQKNIDDSAEQIIDLPFSSTSDGLDFLCKEIIRFSTLRPKISDPLSKFVLKINSDPRFLKFKPLLLKKHTTTKNFNLLRHCLDLGMYNGNDIKDLITIYNPYARDDRFLLYATFAPEIEKVDPNLSYEFFIIISAQNSCPGLHYVLPHLSDYLNDDAKRLKALNKYGCEPGSVAYALKYDDLDGLMDFVAKQHFSISDTITPNNFEPAMMVEGSHFIDYAAFFGSADIFRHLYTLNAKHSNYSRYALAGGNIEIIRLCEDLIKKYPTSYVTAVEFFQSKIFDWILTFLPLSEEIQNQCLFEAAKVCNIRALIFFANRVPDINALDVDHNNALHFAVKAGCIPVIKFLLDKGCNPTVKNSSQMLPKQFTRDMQILRILEEAEEKM